MTSEEKEKLEAAYEIVREFAQMMRRSVTPETGKLYMSSGYEDLDTAAALIGESLGEGYSSRVVSGEDARESLRKIYVYATAAAKNSIDETPAQATALRLQNYAYAMLNAVRNDEEEPVIQEVMEVAAATVKLLSDIGAAGESYFGRMYANPDGDNLTDKLDEMRGYASKLVPGAI